MKNTQEGINSRLNDTMEQIYKPEDRIVEISEAEKKKKRKRNKNKRTVKSLCDNIKHIDIHITGVSSGKGREKGTENIFEDLKVKNFFHLKEETDRKFRKSQTRSTQIALHQDRL